MESEIMQYGGDVAMALELMGEAKLIQPLQTGIH